MVFSIPAGRLADRTSRPAVFLSGYLLLIVLYGVLFYRDQVSTGVLVSCLALLGLYYAATEGILMALASSIIPPQRRTAGIALIATGIGVGKLISSVTFGALWQSVGMQNSLLVFASAMAAALLVTLRLLRSVSNEK
jgi:MFS family permease